MSEVTEIRNILDPQKFNKRVLALIQLRDRLSIPPDVIYQVVLDPLRFSPSRAYLHFDRKNQIYSDVHGWFPVQSINILEVLCECDEKGVAIGTDTIYAELMAQAA
jgi:hypothetical protein